MIFNIPLNKTFEEQMVVSDKDTASVYGSGLIEVFATPAMIALMEKTAMKSVLPYLPQGFGTVGTAVNIKHIKATPIGMKVICESKLEKIEGKKLVFFVKATDEKGEIGNGFHTRVIIETDTFMKNIKV